MDKGQEKHTPGPWKISKNAWPEQTGGADTCIDSEQVDNIAFTSRRNANIIAASPAMYTVLQETLAWLDRTGQNAELQHEICDVLADAEGRG